MVRAVQGLEMPSIVDVRNPLTTYCQSLQVFKRELRDYVSRHISSFVIYPFPVCSPPGGKKDLGLVMCNLDV